MGLVESWQHVNIGGSTLLSVMDNFGFNAADEDILISDNNIGMYVHN